MVIAACRVALRLPENHSLKGKRHVIKSIIARAQNKFSNVSISEIDGQDFWQSAALGIAYVSGEAQHANEVISKVVDFIENSPMDAELIDYEIEIVHVL